MRREREPSMYGDEELSLTSEELYGKYDNSQKMILDARYRIRVNPE
jgi:hypothetical protein